jgi:prepilin-type N-terminal cleavage/methylation domain-containing protein
VKGFTLLELLVVFAILGLLAALLLSELAKVKDQAQTARCVNNLYQLGIALNLYTQDANAYPLATSNGVTGACQPALQTVVPSLKFSCPVQIIPSTNFIRIFNWTGGEISPYYGYNAFGGAYQGSPPYNPGLGGDVNPSTASRTPTAANRVTARSSSTSFLGFSHKRISPTRSTSLFLTSYPSSIGRVLETGMAAMQIFFSTMSMSSLPLRRIGLPQQTRVGACGTATTSPTKSGGEVANPGIFPLYFLS